MTPADGSVFCAPNNEMVNQPLKIPEKHLLQGQRFYRILSHTNMSAILSFENNTMKITTF
ncbi:hypothetical protein A3860_35625 [Niastella vici]|uniref:Uncharacterized protein n=1 Tax=Niastella vici TaxID=1703345 RepID=A0A1V9FNN4_9BACT|nr:hypothetical protein A3860_35625 [Niastella vici]